MDYWALALPRFIQGFAVGFIFVPLSTLTLATIRRDKLVNATAVYGMLRNVGGSVGIAVVTTLLAQRSQFHQATLVSHVTRVGPGDARAPGPVGEPLRRPSGSDAFTAERQAMAMLYRETVTQAQLLAYADDFWLLAVMFAAVPLFLPADAPHPAGALDAGHRARDGARGRARRRVAACCRLRKKVQTRGGARRLHARRTRCTSSVQPRAPTKRMGLLPQPASARRAARAATRRRRTACAPGSCT